jgi:hypothetical protein
MSRTGGALAIAERVHVQEQRLLDLGAVEQAAAALGRDLRVVGEHDRGPEQDVVLRGREHRPCVHTRARALQGRDEAPAPHAQDRVRGQQRPAQRAGAIQVAGRVGAVLDPKRDPLADVEPE